MSHAEDPLSDTPQGDAAQASAAANDDSRPLLERQLDLLSRLAEVGVRIAEAIGAQVESDEAFDGQAVALAYARVARAVRLTILLRTRLSDEGERQARMRKVEADIAAQQQARAAARAAEADAEALQDDEDDVKFRARQIIRRVIKAEHDDIDRIERLDMEACERLDDEDLYGSVLARPMSDLVAGICKDLGLNPDWSRLFQEAWAQAELAGGEVGEALKPFATPPPAEAEPWRPFASDGESETRTLRRALAVLANSS